MDNRSTTIKILKSFEVSDDLRSLKSYVFTVGTFLILLFCSLYSYTINPLYPIFFWIPMGIMLCRFFILQHDCGHNSFFKNRKYNAYAGLVLGFFAMVPSRLWNHIHNVHHGKVGNLDERSVNPELWTLTVSEYKSSNLVKKMFYRFIRSVIFRLFITPAFWMIAGRFPFPALGRKINLAILFHDLIYTLIFFYLYQIGWLGAVAMVYIVPLYLFNFLASIMFYLQHQYENTLWENDEAWDLYDASIHGSSHVKVGRIMRWITGNVGCHHVHHLNTHIPNYNLHKAATAIENLVDVDVIYLKELFHHLNCTL